MKQSKTKSWVQSIIRLFVWITHENRSIECLYIMYPVLTLLWNIFYKSSHKMFSSHPILATKSISLKWNWFVSTQMNRMNSYQVLCLNISIRLVFPNANFVSFLLRIIRPFCLSMRRFICSLNLLTMLST